MKLPMRRRQASGCCPQAQPTSQHLSEHLLGSLVGGGGYPLHTEVQCPTCVHPHCAGDSLTSLECCPASPLSVHQILLFQVLVNFWDQLYSLPFQRLHSDKPLLFFPHKTVTPDSWGLFSGSALSSENGTPMVQAREVSDPKSPRQLGQKRHLNPVFRIQDGDLSSSSEVLTLLSLRPD